MGINANTVEGFERTLLLRNFDNACEIPDCHREWWEACCSSERFVAIAAPRSFAKSTAITLTWLLAKLLFRESVFALIVSDTETQACLFLNDLKKEIANNEDLKTLFDVGPFLKESESDIIVAFKDGHEFRVMAKGSEQKLRGLKWRNRRPDTVVCDDMENDELVMNKDRREKFRRWISSALLPSLSDHGIMRVVGTILHFDSYLNTLMPKDKDKYTVHTPLKTYSTKYSGWLSLKYRAHDKDFSNLLWPQKKSRDVLESIRQVYEAQGQLDVYSQEYLNNPIDEANAHFRRGDFLPETNEDQDKPLTYYITFDGAWSLSQQADYSVFVVAGMDANGYIYIKHVVKERLDSFEFAEVLFNLVAKYDPEMVCTEKGAFGSSILPTVLKKMEEDDVYFRLEMVNPSVDKVQRSQAIRLRARAGRVKVDKSKDWWPDFEEELLAFPRAVHDDQVDALSLVGIAINKFSEAPTVKELKEEAYEEEKRESGMFDFGRCETTGY